MTWAFSGAVLAGGRSRRMGRDKALLEVGGRPLAAVARHALHDAGAGEVLAVGGDRPALAALGLDARRDDHPGEGPLGGVLTALRLARLDVVVVLACDLPGTTPLAVATVRAALGPADDVAVPVVGGRAHPLHAAWRASARPQLAAAFAAGARSMADGMAGLRVRTVPLSDPGWVANANTPEELARAAGVATGVAGAGWAERSEAARMAGTASEERRVPDDTPTPEIDVADLARRHGEGAWVLDVRQPDEYEAGHVPGAHLLPLDQLPARAGEVPRDRPVLVICRSGARSAVATRALRDAGWDATNVAGGTLAWAEAGHPIVEGPNER